MGKSKKNSNDDISILDIIVGIGSAVTEVAANAGANICEIAENIHDRSVEVKAAKDEVNKYVELQEIMVNLSTLSERIRMECDTNTEIYRRNAIVAKKAIQSGYIENEEEIARILNTSVSDRKLIAMLKEEVGNI